MRQVIQERSRIPIHSVARESVLVFKETDVKWVRLQLSPINQWSGERVDWGKIVKREVDRMSQEMRVHFGEWIMADKDRKADAAGVVT